RCHVFKGELAPSAAAFDPAGLGVAARELGKSPPDVFFGQRDECLDCHDDAQGALPAVVTHAEPPCLDCHQPHGDGGLAAKSCLDCHQHVDLHHGSRSADTRPVRRQCLDCHQPHGPAAGVGQACVKCHGSETPVIPASATFAGGHESCNGCHRSHDLRRAAASSCEGCHGAHQALGAGRIPAHSACTSCHNPHDVREGAQKSCAGCHS